MNKDIRLRGITSDLSDYDCPDGDLSLSINMIYEEEAIRPIPAPVGLGEEYCPPIPTGVSVVYIHKMSDGQKNFIALKESYPSGELGIIGIPQRAKMPQDWSIIKTKTERLDREQITAIGNTLILLTSSGIEYYLWRNGIYEDLGNGLPEVTLSFGLQSEIPIAGREKDKFSPYGYDRPPKKGADGYKQVTEVAIGKINKFVQEYAVEQDRFCFPFFVRYALRLYDGSLVMHSAPILMLANTARPRFYNMDSRDHGSLVASTVVHQLDYQVLGYDAGLLNGWQDIVQSVDIFVSPPIYTYTQDPTLSIDEKNNWIDYQQIAEAQRAGYIPGYSVSRHTKGNGAWKEYRKRSIADYTGDVGAFLSYTQPNVPMPTAEEMDKEVKSMASFYLISSIPTSQLRGGLIGRQLVPIQRGTLKALQTRELMSDDTGYSHEPRTATGSYIYNSRLHLLGVARRPFGGYLPLSVTPYCQHNSSYRAFVYIKEDGDREDTIVASEPSGFDLEVSAYYYYPNPKARKVVFQNIERNEWWEVALTRHEFLNGAYAYAGGWKPLKAIATTALSYPIISNTPNRLLGMQDNKLQVSEAGNPFVFPAKSVHTIGTGRLLGLATATKAISEGQYGQFPLYAFTSEGIWALELSDTGAYIAKQAISRDVCINPRSITQIDNAVVFASQRGLMIIRGGEVAELSKQISSGNAFGLMRSFPNILGGLNLEVIEQRSGVSRQHLELPNFVDFVKDCEILYDYVHQRIIVYQPNTNKEGLAYVYSMLSGWWTAITHRIQYKLNSYPEALAWTSDRDIVDYAWDSKPLSIPSLRHKGILITRPFKLDAGDALKTITTTFLRGMYDREQQALILLATRDYTHWLYVADAIGGVIRGYRGTGYKAFRLVILSDLADWQSLSGVSIEYDVKQNNQLR